MYFYVKIKEMKADVCKINFKNTGKMKRIIFLFMCGVVFFAASCNQAEQPYVIVVSLDAFRWDYCDLYDTPNLNKIVERGVKAESVKSSFPTVTFPNHYTMATGLYPNNHGIVNNKFYAADLNLEYAVADYTAMENPDFWAGEPIWVTAETQAVNTAAFFWVGSETKIKGIYPDFWQKYNEPLPLAQRADTIIKWLQLPAAVRPHLIMWYFHEPDAVGHRFGPVSAETGQMVHLLDSLMGNFMDKLKRLPIAEKVNVIITSDHGMAELSPDRVLYLEDYVRAEWLERVWLGATSLLYTKPEYREQVYENLQKMPHATAYKREAMPERLHYGSNPRIGDIVLVADCGWSVLHKGNTLRQKGTHGYDNACPDMNMIFFAYGPAFKKNHVQPEIANVDLYNMIAHILKIKPVSNDGDFERIRGMLQD
jgi:predicted AlkP superfamily pyrophosphatase or phosphodiesterase